MMAADARGAFQDMRDSFEAPRLPAPPAARGSGPAAVAKRRIPPVYLFDAAAEIVLVAGWVASHRDTEAQR